MPRESQGKKEEQGQEQAREELRALRARLEFTEFTSVTRDSYLRGALQTQQRSTEAKMIALAHT